MSAILYRKFPISFETNEYWLSLSLKRRELFRYLMSKCVYTESHIFKGIALTFGQYLISYRDLADEFNRTVTDPDDKIDRNFITRFFKKLEEFSFLTHKEMRVARQPITLITITQSDACELLKTYTETRNAHSETTPRQQNAHTPRHDARQEKKEEKQADITIEDNKSTIENTGSETGSDTLKNFFKQFERDTQSETDQQNHGYVYEKTMSGDLPFINNQTNADIVNASRRYKLDPDQTETVRWLASQKINSDLPNFCYWAKNYELQRIKEVHAHAKSTNPDSLGALMSSLLSNNSHVLSSWGKENREFLEAYAQEIGWKNVKIAKKYASCSIKGTKKEVYLGLAPKEFLNQIIKLYNLSKA